jgi:glycosyltransferase involved in cell wall biosynthesis
MAETAVCLVAPFVGTMGSGTSRFLLSLAKGLRKCGSGVEVCSLMMTPDARDDLESAGSIVHTRGLGTRSLLTGLSSVTLFNTMGRKLAELATRESTAQSHVVLSDDALAFAKHFTKTPRTLLSNGDLALLYSSDAFYNRNGSWKSLLSLQATQLLRVNSRLAASFDLRLGNCEFTRNLMSFLYGLPFQGHVFPPVDPIKFRPSQGKAGAEPFVFAVARNQNEQGLPLLRKLASAVPVRIAGGARVVGATNLGRISDPELVRAYTTARFLAFPVISEPFGYPIAEAQACGTPSVAFDTGGPAEQITHGRNGWLVRSDDEFVRFSVNLFNSGYDPEIRQTAVQTSKRFAPEECGRALLRLMGETPA